MLYIRADANSTIGSGHIMRCLSIANALRKLGENTVFITADTEAESLIISNGFEMICLNSSWEHLNDELERLKYIIDRKGIQKLLVDSYFITADYLAKLRELVKVIYIDDLSKCIYTADILINYSICAYRFGYEERYSNATKLLIGCRYIPLREEFFHIRREQKENITDILITTGGSDSYNIAGTLIQEIRSKPEFEFIKLHVVVGAFNINRDMLVKMKDAYQNVNLYRNVTRMSELMQNCDIALSAGGTTLYELCACGTPTICFTFADNQIEGAKELDRQGLLYYTGDVRNNKEFCIKEMISKIKLLQKDSMLRKFLSDEMMTVVDGKGAGRIAEELLML